MCSCTGPISEELSLHFNATKGLRNVVPQPRCEAGNSTASFPPCKLVGSQQAWLWSLCLMCFDSRSTALQQNNVLLVSSDLPQQPNHTFIFACLFLFNLSAPAIACLLLSDTSYCHAEQNGRWELQDASAGTDMPCRNNTRKVPSYTAALSHRPFVPASMPYQAYP